MNNAGKWSNVQMVVLIFVFCLDSYGLKKLLLIVVYATDQTECLLLF